MFKKNARVSYRTPRGGQVGVGKIVEIHQTGRGVWFEVRDDATRATVKLRAACLSQA